MIYVSPYEADYLREIIRAKRSVFVSVHPPGFIDDRPHEWVLRFWTRADLLRVKDRLDYKTPGRVRLIEL